ncbi:MAG TPA: hypothetical protein PLN91_01845 [Rhodanobacteraceae bacterium]|nr:hypothetical protein [Rhodanobacteraceae bacterium]
MQRHLIALVAGLALSLPLFAGTGPDIDKVNGSIHLKDGQVGGDLSTVNGSIDIDDHARAGEAQTVNGAIELGADTEVKSLETVNGEVHVGPRGRVLQTLETVNGAISLDAGAEVLGHLSNVNGRIRLQGAHAAAGIETVAGDIEVGADSRVEGGILVERQSGFHFGASRPPRIVIGPRAVVEGRLVFKREVELFVSDSAKIGAVEGAKAVSFSGAQPQS